MYQKNISTNNVIENIHYYHQNMQTFVKHRSFSVEIYAQNNFKEKKIYCLNNVGKNASKHKNSRVQCPKWMKEKRK